MAKTPQGRVSIDVLRVDICPTLQQDLNYFCIRPDPNRKNQRRLINVLNEWSCCCARVFSQNFCHLLCKNLMSTAICNGDRLRFGIQFAIKRGGVLLRQLPCSRARGGVSKRACSFPRLGGGVTLLEFILHGVV